LAFGTTPFRAVAQRLYFHRRAAGAGEIEGPEPASSEAATKETVR
jgi:hypothetical protein